MLNNTKKIKLKYFLFPNLSIFIISIFQKNSELWLTRSYLTAEKEFSIFIKKHQKLTLAKNKTKFVYFVIFIFFIKLRLKFQLIVFISHVIFIENLNETKNMIQHRNFELLLNFFQKDLLSF